MRLLSTRQIGVTEVYGSNIPRYAILSHTWTDDEVLLQDLQALGPADWDLPDGSAVVEPDNHRDSFPRHGSVFGKKGFSKLQQSTALARRNGFDYIWIDTCCIDKTSSAELSEAINSMYRWYQDADVCYAYLEDVRPAGTEDPMDERSSFRRSRWFTRGWTLQELIAPSKVEFFAGDWSYLGNKTESAEFTSLLHQITGVQHGVLTGHDSLADISIASVRMRWAAFRETTRVEDIAYCLLGLFDVNMPLLYGEGTKAFIRLQEEILLRDDDQSLFAWYTDDAPEELDDADTVGTVSRLKSLSGLLADSPRRFWATGDIATATPLALGGEPAALTSRGLRVDLFLLPCDGVHDADFQAVLSCERLTQGKREVPVIYLKRIWGTGDNSARVRTGLRQFVSLNVHLWGDGFYKSVFVKQDPSLDLRVIRIVPALDNSQLHLPGYRDFKPRGTELVWRVKEAHPRHAWNEEAQYFETRDLVFDMPTAVFRIEVDVVGHDPLSVDVAVGMGFHNERTCKSWCQIIGSWTMRRKTEDSWNIFVQEVHRRELRPAELSTRNIYEVDMPTWAVVTERNRKKGIEVSLHIVSDGSFTSKLAPKDSRIDDVTMVDEPFSGLEVVTAEELRRLGLPDYQPSTIRMAQWGNGFWDHELQALLECSRVEDSVEITVVQKVNLGNKVRMVTPSSAAVLYHDGRQKTSSPL